MDTSLSKERKVYAEFHVAKWFVQPQLGTITKGDETVHLEPKVMEVLVYLATLARTLLQ